MMGTVFVKSTGLYIKYFYDLREKKNPAGSSNGLFFLFLSCSCLFLGMSHCLQFSITHVDYKRKDPVFWIDVDVIINLLQ